MEDAIVFCCMMVEVIARHYIEFLANEICKNCRRGQDDGHLSEVEIDRPWCFLSCLDEVPLNDFRNPTISIKNFKRFL